MDVAMVSASLSQLELRHEVAVQTQRMAMDSAKAGGEALIRMIDDVASITDTALGTGIDELA